jgi:membrane-bound metal-dependent hydrolase YbcI (DUF457 family)
MPSPVAHSLVGALVYVAAASPDEFTASFTEFIRKNSGKLAACVFLSNFPDFDMIAGYFLKGDVHFFHGKVTHSLLAAVFFAFLAGVIFPVFRTRWRTMLMAMILIASHDLMDCAGTPDFSNHGAGVWLFFPLEKSITSPVPLFYGFRHKTVEQLTSAFNFFVIGVETMVFGMLLWFVYMFRKKVHGAPITDPPPGGPWRHDCLRRRELSGRAPDGAPGIGNG